MSKKIARDLNIKNIEERVFELEKNPGGGSGTDEKAEKFINNNYAFDDVTEDIPVGIIVRDEDNKLKVNQNYLYLSPDIERDNKNLQELHNPAISISEMLLYTYISGYNTDPADNTSSLISPVYDTINKEVIFDLSKYNCLAAERACKAGIKIAEGGYREGQTSFEKSLNLTFAKTSQFPNVSPVLLDNSDKRTRIHLSLFQFDETAAVAFSNTAFKIKLKIGEVRYTYNPETYIPIFESKSGFALNRVESAVVSKNLLSEASFFKTTYQLKVGLYATENVVDGVNIAEQYIVIEIPENTLSESDLKYATPILNIIGYNDKMRKEGNALLDTFYSDLRFS